MLSSPQVVDRCGNDTMKLDKCTEKPRLNTAVDNLR
jgi:hypothetical protein